ncbi:MAG: bifunctional phosphoglucose/phosphomannose isomerase [Chloroflexi bacterium]|nr:bifunctional phosphoglucose/phosphomannose isomerase [Chloroflexota bacterium]MCL5074031.1 bifunctional phosphoglucose/phosphomannose isomerase [Chloroflexota bacterium]
MMKQLDDLEVMQRIDPEGMLDRISELPRQCYNAWQTVTRFRLPSQYGSVDNAVILGMGGSAIGGDLVRSLLADEARIPVIVCREYHVPSFVGPNTLVIGSSYSGNTEETLSAFQEAVAKGAKAVAVCTGGKLRDWAEKEAIPVLCFDYQAQPRAALGYSITLLLGLFQGLGLCSDKTVDVKETIEILEEMPIELGPELAEEENKAKQLAKSIYGRLPVVYGGGILSEVARRWKTQFNENSKAWSCYEAFPELNHNAVVGYEFPQQLASYILVILLDSDGLPPRLRLRYKVTQQIMDKYNIQHRLVKALGKSSFAQMMSALYFGDFTSYYLAILYGVDPTPVSVIGYLKEQLAAIDLDTGGRI